MSLVQVYQNFGYWISQKATTETKICSLKFEEYDPKAMGTATSGSGNLRKFFVEWLDSDADSAATDSDRREAWHVFRTHFEYPSKALTYSDLHKLILADRDDIIEQLREANQTNMVGFSAADTTSDIGLYARIRMGDELNKSNPDVWRLTIQWRCKIRESEQ